MKIKENEHKMNKGKLFNKKEWTSILYKLTNNGKIY